MQSLPYFRLIVLTVGTLLPFFWMMVILGHRRQRNLERVLFFLCLAIACFCGSSLLALNAQLYYGTPPTGVMSFAWTFLCLGLWFIPPLVVHLHAEYGSLRELIATRTAKRLWVLLAYLPALLLAPYLFAALRAKSPGFQAPSLALGRPFQVWLIASLLIGFYWQRRFQSISPDDEQKRFHKWLSWDFLLVIGNLIFLFTIQHFYGYEPRGSEGFSDLVILLAIVSPLVGFFQGVQNFNFLQFGRQRNLIYAVFGVFLALLYLSFVRRAGQWLEPYLPPAATAALLLFLPVVFFEPLQRLIRQLLRQTAQAEVDRAQKLMGPINEVARLGDSEKLRQFAARWIGEQLQLAEVQLEMSASSPVSGCELAAKTTSEEVFVIGRAGNHHGRLRIRAHGAMISGETYTALEFLAEQLPAAFDLCRLIEEKLQLDRELAERERMALVGQMAASISHNLKNPLGSIKTILQVQMESPELPASLRRETHMVLEEVNRLSGKLSQLLQFSRPGARQSAQSERCHIVAVASSVAEVLCREAESRGIALELAPQNDSSEVTCSAEAANDVLSNVILNAIEAASHSGRVSVRFARVEQAFTVMVEDDGPGISPELREKILQPFFTTKPRGTGLGLAIVARRLEEIGGRLEINSPVSEGHGTRFLLEFPLAPEEVAK